MKLKLSNIFIFAFGVQYMISCSDKEEPEKVQSQMRQELSTIDSLLRDSVFTESVAKTLDSSYYAGIGQPSPPFITAADDTTFIYKPVRIEKIAMRLAGFYALECGIGYLASQSNTTPIAWLQKIVNGTADSNAILLLNRFANATWKAGQPFRGLSRIKRENFIIASSLSQQEVDKDYFQIYHSSEKLLSSLKSSETVALSQQMEVIRSLLQDTAYAIEITSYLHSSHDSTQKPSNEPFLSPADDTAIIKKTSREIKIATSVAGFYALECGLNYLVTTTKELPSTILRSLVNDSISLENKMLFARFANATWKAGQPFRDLNRISRTTFTPFYFLTDADIEKDMVQIRAAARRILSEL